MLQFEYIVEVIMDKSEELAKIYNIPVGKAKETINLYFESMADSLKSGHCIEIRGFGSFEVNHYKSYPGRNPKTGATVEVTEKKLPFFKVCKIHKEKVAG